MRRAFNASANQFLAPPAKRDDSPSEMRKSINPFTSDYREGFGDFECMSVCLVHNRAARFEGANSKN